MDSSSTCSSFDLLPPAPPPQFTSLLQQQQPHHPPYAEMIYKAIEALKEKDGSSKRAIGKYIEHVYKQVLPPQQQHATLLTQHLNHLKYAGLLIMIKKSYKLPSSLPPPPTLITRSTAQSHLPFTPLITTQQRPRGRPPKPKPQQQQQQNNVLFVSLDTTTTTTATVPPPTTTTTTVDPVRRRGRGRPPGTFRSKTLKSPGRPPKPKSVSNAGFKRRPGRPPKIQSQQPTVIPFAASILPDHHQPTLSSARSTRPRGRPNKYADDDAPVVAPATKAVARPNNSSRRPVGRPKGSKAAKKLNDEDLRKKLEHFQSKIKESLDVLKPYFDKESPVTAVAAIQELEMLATLDLKAPLRDETQQQQPQPFSEQEQPQPEQPQPEQQLPPQQLHPQLVTQAQIYEQQYLQMPFQPQVQQLFQPHTLAPS
ncbi:histone H1-II-like [Trifolium pratense]|uniref:histone H1-II-like n=1 Tax=Trifolium pratense TaxID=57577 RepID=UPI001E6914E5|nr:histone H1-II-like [Trifolium pratense]